MDWRPDHVKRPVPPLTESEIDLLQTGLDKWRDHFEGYDPIMDWVGWQPVTELMRKLEQLRIGH